MYLTIFIFPTLFNLGQMLKESSENLLEKNILSK